MSREHIETFEAIHRAEHLLQRAAVGLEFVAQLFAVTDEAVSAARETLTIDLIPVAQSRLHHTVSAIDLQDEPVDVGHQLFVDFR